MITTDHIVVADALGDCDGPIRAALEAGGYRHVSYAADYEAVLTLCVFMRVDVLLIDMSASGEAAVELVRTLQPQIQAGAPQVIVVADESPSSHVGSLLGLGVRDWLARPFNEAEVSLSVSNALSSIATQEQLRTRNLELEQAVQARVGELADARREVLRHLATATEFRDDDTGEHTERVGRTAAAIAQRAGVDPELVRMIRDAAPLHDVGKIGVPDQILLKPGRLTEAERLVMQTHTEIGAAILADSHVPELQLAETIALSHHERYDGSGYPHRLRGVAIPLEARIVAIADVFDALVHDRPYKQAWSVQDALAEIKGQRGRHFDANLVDVFLGLDHRCLMSPVTSSPPALTKPVRGHAAADRVPGLAVGRLRGDGFGVGAAPLAAIAAGSGAVSGLGLEL